MFVTDTWLGLGIVLGIGDLTEYQFLPTQSITANANLFTVSKVVPVPEFLKLGSHSM